MALFRPKANVAELARQFKLTQYNPVLVLENLIPGVDNVRHDVFLSPKFCGVARAQVARMIAKYGNVEDLAQLGPQSGSPAAIGTVRTLPMLGPQGGPPKPAAPKQPDPADFKNMLGDLHAAALDRAKAEENPSLDMLARLAVLKFLRAELGLQFSIVLERCRSRLSGLEGPRAPNPAKAIEIRDRVGQLHVNKKHIIRKSGQELFQTWREVEKEKLARLRRSLLGDEQAELYGLLINRLLFTEDVWDDYLNAEHYVMLGNYERDPDRVARMAAIAAQFLESIGALKLAPNYATYDGLLSQPENAQELVAAGAPDEETAKGKAQRAVLNAWTELLEEEGVMDRVVASYEVVALLAHYWPQIHAQQLKAALLSKEEHGRVMTLLQEHGKLSPDALNVAQKRVAGLKGTERAKVAGRFLLDFMRYRRDLRRMEAVNAACDQINLITSDKLRELSSINHTLYEFLLPVEQKPAEEKVIGHVIVKADVRDSTTLTRTLLERGLNPASYFSLNFYDPVNKLLPRFDATKVFLEGDAVILAVFEREGERSACVARACALAREMIQVVRGYNEQSANAGLPTLEIGIGICYKDAAPMYLMDGTSRIMISSALNESDRLSGSSKGARRLLAGRETPFNVFTFQTVEDKDTGGNPDEFLMRYNVSGINISAEAFRKLREEISLREHKLDLPMLWNTESVTLYRGLVPVSGASFSDLVVRVGMVPHIDAADGSLKEWTQRPYYEVCTSASIYEALEAGSQAMASR
ncbi:MAG TPA: hypothetical protein VFA60_16265 [Terriglobales bacterium]|nr:hypothetical protein [Terriglobales bacterium]